MAEQDVRAGLKPAPGSTTASHPSVLRGAGAMGAATFISRIMGLVREQVFAILFGAGNVTDAFNIAFRIPNLLRDLFAEGAMSASLVPTFTRTRAEQGDPRAWRVVGLVFRVLFVLVAALAALGIVFAPELVALYASAFKAVPGKFELTVRMTRIIFPFFPLVALAAAFMGVLNACGYFFLPAFASALFNVTSIVVGVVAAKLIQYVWPDSGFHPIEGMALGVVAGGLVQALCQLPTLYRTGYRWRPREAREQGAPTWRKDPALRTMLWMMIPGTIGLAATQVNILVNSVLATSQGPGAVSWLAYAFRLMQFPIGIFGVSIATATLPRVARQWVDRDVPGVAATLSRSLRTVFAINLPASAGLAFLGFPIIQLIFQYGRFYPEDVQATAFALAMYSTGLTAYSAVKVLVPACYALGNTRVPVISSFVAVAVTVVLNLLMVGPFGYWGLALGTSIAAMVNGLFLLFSLRSMLRKAGGDLELGPIARSFAANLGVALLMGVACYFSHQLLSGWVTEMSVILTFGKPILPLFRALKTGLLIVEGMVVVVILARVLGLSETMEAVDFFTGKLKKKLSRKRT